MKEPEEIDKFCQFLDQLTIRSRTNINTTTPKYDDQLFGLNSNASKKTKLHNILYKVSLILKTKTIESIFYFIFITLNGLYFFLNLPILFT